jgi:transcriptional regulator with XRE-family HTH domain
MPHYTSGSEQAFVDRLVFDFVAQLESKLDSSGTTQTELAEKLSVTEGAVSQFLNMERSNPSVKTMHRYARAVGMKLAIVAYDDGDPSNQNGPVGSELFALAWEKLGRPRDSWSLNESLESVTPSRSLSTSVPAFSLVWNGDWTNSTLAGVTGTSPLVLPPVTTTEEKRSTVYARD